MMGAAVAVRRGCRSRQSGGVYLECGLSPYGEPIETFLFDPPLVDLPPDWLKPHRMPELFQRDGIWHVVIWVGEEFYPHVFDFIEETRVAGASRRVPKTFDFSKLTPQSRMYFVHAAAAVTAEGFKDRVLLSHCPRGIHGLAPDQSLIVGPQCLGVTTYLQTAVPHAYGQQDLGNGCLKRTLPCGHSYELYHPPDDVTLTAAPGMFLQLPITGLCLVTKRDGSFDADVKARVERAAVPVYEAEA